MTHGSQREKNHELVADHEAAARDVGQERDEPHADASRHHAELESVEDRRPGPQRLRDTSGLSMTALIVQEEA